MNPEIEALLAKYGITPEEFQQMAEAGVFDERNQAMQVPMARSQMAADAPMPQGQTVGQFYVPPSGLSQLSALGSKVLGQYQLGTMQGQQQSLIDTLRGGKGTAGLLGMRSMDNERQMLLDLLRRVQQRPPALEDLKDPYPDVPDQTPGPWASGYVPFGG